jgi:hypothetical protein
MLPVVRVTPGIADPLPGCRMLPKLRVTGIGLMNPVRFWARSPVASGSASKNPQRVLMG